MSQRCGRGEEYGLLRGPQSPYGDDWNFLTNEAGITRFWQDGLRRNHQFENVYTMGMRGEHDTPHLAYGDASGKHRAAAPGIESAKSIDAGRGQS
ncbi:hypothetical protein EFT87_14140 [Schleiferilactobacillus harbinensis]|uniref:glycosyl hydrolase 115 family protein n=1 Tax=Schleiferilactobacillus harbinensis TaxID=304207 RepID=UPI002972631A|nr:hypothetical protein [Schleiferilactobacillus harbinensis]